MRIMNQPSVILASPAAAAAESDALWSYSFDSAADQADPEGTGGSFETYAGRNLDATYHSTGSWDGGSFVRGTYQSSITTQDDSGIFLDVSSLNLYGKNSIGWIVRHGTTWLEHCDGTPKMYLERIYEDGDPEVKHGEGSVIYEEPACTAGPSYYVPCIGANPGDSGHDEYDRLFPTDYCDHTFDYSDLDPDWYYEEVTHDYGGNITFSIFSRDGLVSKKDFVTLSSLVTNTSITKVNDLRYLAFTQPDGSQDSNSYIDVADVYANDVYMGPPPGFVT